ncbi:hypothetical protein HPB50_014215 [Hyalomma asiaticum]|uniref:Uncharacterized protein n=1 Tax=Hyalomma asiaticum TaxID=266040 RepID=A0ACB7T695_HYAAI|nr:hypothetical protein HPB50_014215 [Hyalomma asiaticum]
MWTEELDSFAVKQRFPGIKLTLPCSASDNVGRETPSFCHVIDSLSRWNYFFWHVGLQLRELRSPGRLSLVQVVYRGSGGCKQQARGLDARILFYILLVQHRCVESVHLEDILIEGCGLGEYRERIVDALRKNTSLRALTLGSLFGDYRSIRDDLFGAISTMTNLRELFVYGDTAAPSFLLEALCPLLIVTMNLRTLCLSGLVFDEADRRHLITALKHNNTVENLAVHGSILHSYRPTGVSRFSRFLATSTRLSSLSVEGMHMDPESTYEDLQFILSPLVSRAQLQRLRLTGYLLNAECAALLAELVSRKEGGIRTLDITGCWWRAKSSEERGPDGGTAGGGQVDQPTSEEPCCRWLQAFDSTAPVELTYFALSVEGLQPEDLRALLKTAVRVESLKTISLRDASVHNLERICRVIRETEASGRVRLEGTFLIDSEEIGALREFPEVLHKVAISSLDCPNPKVFGDAVLQAFSLYQLTTLNLLLSQEVLSDVATLHKLSNCLGSAVSLKKLALIGLQKPDLSCTLRSLESRYSLLLEKICKNASIRVLRMRGLRLGEHNVWYLVGEVIESKTLCEIFFASCEPDENDLFLEAIADDFCRNNFITKCHVLQSKDDEGERWLAVEEVIGRNMGFLTCAAHFEAHKDLSLRCSAAFGRAPHLDDLDDGVHDCADLDRHCTRPVLFTGNIAERQPLVCIIGDRLSTVHQFPPDKVCDYIFYDSLYKEGVRNLLPDQSTFSSSLNTFLNDHRGYRHTTLGLGFAFQ